VNERYKCIECHQEYHPEYGKRTCCGEPLKPVVKLRAIFSGDVDRELGYKYVPLTEQGG
jgi:hypothetical protein